MCCNARPGGCAGCVESLCVRLAGRAFACPLRRCMQTDGRKLSRRYSPTMARTGARRGTRRRAATATRTPLTASALTLRGYQRIKLPHTYSKACCVVALAQRHALLLCVFLQLCFGLPCWRLPCLLAVRKAPAPCAQVRAERAGEPAAGRGRAAAVRGHHGVLAHAALRPQQARHEAGRGGPGRPGPHGRQVWQGACRTLAI